MIYACRLNLNEVEIRSSTDPPTLVPDEASWVGEMTKGEKFIPGKYVTEQLIGQDGELNFTRFYVPGYFEKGGTINKVKVVLQQNRFKGGRRLRIIDHTYYRAIIGALNVGTVQPLNRALWKHLSKESTRRHQAYLVNRRRRMRRLDGRD